MNAAKFLDTNILLYAYDLDAPDSVQWLYSVGV